MSDNKRNERLNKLTESLVEFDNGNIGFKHHFESEDGSVMGWYAMEI